MENQDATTIRLRIAGAIGRDSMLLTSADEVRHFDGISFVAFYGGQLFLHFVAAALPKLWDKLQDKAAEKLVDATWEKAGGKIKAVIAEGDAKTDSGQIEQIGQVSSGLAELGQALEAQYLGAFVSAGQDAIELRLREDNIPEASAKRIAAAVAEEVKHKLSTAHVQSGGGV